MAEVGTLYLIHLETPVCHASHYLGFTSRTPEQRFEDHASGRGARLTAAAAKRNIAMKIVWTGPGTRSDERKLKNRSNHRQLCPICREAHLAKRAADKRRQRSKVA